MILFDNKKYLYHYYIWRHVGDVPLVNNLPAWFFEELSAIVKQHASYVIMDFATKASGCTKVYRVVSNHVELYRCLQTWHVCQSHWYSFLKNFLSISQHVNAKKNKKTIDMLPCRCCCINGDNMGYRPSSIYGLSDTFMWKIKNKIKTRLWPPPNFPMFKMQ